MSKALICTKINAKNLDKITVLLFWRIEYMINTSDVFTQKIREKHNLKKIAVKRSDVFEENETSDELRRQKQKDGRDFFVQKLPSS